MEATGPYLSRCLPVLLFLGQSGPIPALSSVYFLDNSGTYQSLRSNTPVPTTTFQSENL